MDPRPATPPTRGAILLETRVEQTRPKGRPDRQADRQAAHRLGYKRLHRKKQAFLAVACDGWSVARACAAVGIARLTFYRWQESDLAFAAAYRLARAEATERLEDEARRRAVDGVQRVKPVYHEGEQIGTITETDYSDTLLIFLLKGLKPEVYRDKVQVSANVRVGGDDDVLTDDELAAISAALLALGPSG